MASKLFESALKNLVHTSRRALSTDRFVWVDLEMTGLDLDKDRILEIACIITTPELDKVHDGIHLIIHETEDVLNSMNSWCKEHHFKSGLTEACRNSKINLSNAEKQVAQYIQNYGGSTNYLSGNSVYMDKLFLSKYMPDVDSLLHYRIIDISSIKTLGMHWYPDELQKLPPKKCLHRALDDIQESIDELKAYRKILFK